MSPLKMGSTSTECRSVHGSGPRAHDNGNNGPERGAAIVEIALAVPMLAMLLFGIIEFGWAFTQNLDVRHGAQEGARLAAINYSTGTSTGSTQTSEIIGELCSRMEYADGTTVALSFDSSDTTVGSAATLVVTHTFDDMTGFYSSLIGDIDLQSTIAFRLEQDATWAATGSDGETCP